MRRTQKDGLFEYPLLLKLKPLRLGGTGYVEFWYEGGAEARNSMTNIEAS